jgi:acyl carrier protein
MFDRLNYVLAILLLSISFASFSINPDIEKRVRDVIWNTLGIQEDKSNSAFVELGVDSLDMIKLIDAMEQEFKIRIPYNKRGEIRTIEDAINYVEKSIKNPH